MELKLFTAQAAAEQLNVSPDLIWKAVRNGEIETLDIPGQHVIFTEQALNAWVQRRAVAGNAVDVPACDVVTCSEVADVAGMSLQGVTNWIRRGKAQGQMVRGKWAFTWPEARRLAREKGFLEQLEELERKRRSA